MVSRLCVQQNRAGEGKGCEMGLWGAGIWIEGFVSGTFSSICCLSASVNHLLCTKIGSRSHIMGTKSQLTIQFLVFTLLLLIQCSVLSSNQCVCVYQEQSVLGLEVEVISLIGTRSSSLPTSLPLLLSSLLMMLFSAVSSLSPSLVICPNLSPFHSFSAPSPSVSCYLSLFISHLFSAAGSL